MTVELGNAIAQVGGMIFGVGKDKMLDKLAAEKEKRADEREKAREERQRLRKLNEVAETTITQSADGKMVNQRRNIEGTVLGEEPVDPYTLDKINMAREKDKLSIDKLSNDTAKSKLELEYYPKLKEAEIAGKHSLAESYEARGRSYDAQALQRLSGQPSGRAAQPPKYTAPAKSSLEAAFGKPSKDGKIVIDQSAVQEYMASPERLEDPSGERSLAAYLANRGQDEQLREQGTPEFAIREMREAARTGQGVDISIPERESLTSEQRQFAEIGDKALARARRAIAEGKLTKEEARRQLRERGYNKAAEQIR